MTREEAIGNLIHAIRWNDTPKKEALEMAVEALKQEPCEDCISREDALMALTGEWTELTDEIIHRFIKRIKSLPPVKPTEKEKQEPKWIPVKWHEITDEERKENDYPKEWACYLDSIMPYDGQKILITTKGGYVELDECYSDDGQTFSLDSGYDWVDDVVAWMPLPKPYEQEVEE